MRDKIKGWLLISIGIIACYTMTALAGDPAKNQIVSYVSFGSKTLPIYGIGFVFFGVLSMVMGAYLIKKETTSPMYYEE